MFDAEKKAKSLINKHIGLGLDQAKHIAIAIAEEVIDTLQLDEIVNPYVGYERVFDFWEDVIDEIKRVG